MADRLDTLVEFGRSIIGQNDFPTLFKNVVDTSCATLGAEGGTFYLYDEVAHKLEAVVAYNSVCAIDHVLAEFNPSNIQGLFGVALDRDLSRPQASISGECYRTRKEVVIANIRKAKKFELGGVRSFDAQYGYETRSILAIPLLNHHEEVLGVLQLVNAAGIKQRANIKMLKTMASFIGMTLENSMLRLGSEQLFVSVVSMISAAIDQRSKVTGDHSFRVTELTMMLAEAMDRASEGPYRDVNFSRQELEELKIAALLHDVGKLSTPDYVLEKGRKLIGVSDRIDYLRMRFRARALELRVARLEEALAAAGATVADGGDEELDDLEFIGQLNLGGEFLSDEQRQRLDDIASRSCLDGQLIEGAELENLRIKRGTLNSDELKVMRNHVSVSADLLSKLPWPKHYAHVPEIAAKHHENVNGTGYPNGITGADMSLRAKMLSLTDRFEGLTAPDRSYRTAKKLAEVVAIMERMAAGNEIDPELYRFFVDSKVMERYTRKYLAKDQL